VSEPLPGSHFVLDEISSARKEVSLIWFVGFASGALLTKQNSIYLALVLRGLGDGSRRLAIAFETSGFVERVERSADRRPYYFLVYRTHWQSTVMNLTDKGVSGTSSWLFYWKALPGQLGWMLLALSLLGLVTSPRWDRRKVTLLMLSWIAACYVTFSLIGFKDARFALYWLPPLPILRRGC